MIYLANFFCSLRTFFWYVFKISFLKYLNIIQLHFTQNLITLLRSRPKTYNSVLIRQCTHLSVALRKRILERRLPQTRLPYNNRSDVDHQQPVQITVESFVHELFDAVLQYFRVLVDLRDQAEINLVFGLMQELIHILEIDPQRDLEVEHNACLLGLVTEFGHLVKYFRW